MADNIVIFPQAQEITQDDHLQFKAYYIDHAGQQPIAHLIWSSSNPAIVEIDGDGLAKSHLIGDVVITASYNPPPILLAAIGVPILAPAGPLSGYALLRVIKKLEKIEINPNITPVKVGDKAQFEAKKVYSDGTTDDITPCITNWASRDLAIAEIDSAGVVNARKEGFTIITGSYDCTEYSYELEIEHALDRLKIEPASATVEKGQKHQFKLFEVYTDGYEVEVIRGVIWVSSDATIANVNNTGLATARKVGSVTITATYPPGNPIDASLTVPPQLTSIEIVPYGRKPRVGDMLNLRCIANYSDGSSADITNSISNWTSSDPVVATIDGVAGTIAALDIGKTNINANFGGLRSQNYSLEIFAGVDYLKIEPCATELKIGSTDNFRAAVVYTDGSQTGITNDPNCVWSSSLSAIASVDNLPPNRGLVTAIGEGEAQIIITYGGREAHVGLTVKPAVPPTVPVAVIPPPVVVLTSIEIVPDAFVLGVDNILQLYAFEVYSDNSRRDITEQVTWRVADRSILSVGNDLLDKGQARGLSQGITTITADNGTMRADITIMVGNDTLFPQVFIRKLSDLFGSTSQEVTLTNTLLEGIPLAITVKDRDVTIQSLNTAWNRAVKSLANQPFNGSGEPNPATLTQLIQVEQVITALRAKVNQLLGNDSLKSIY